MSNRQMASNSEITADKLLHLSNEIGRIAHSISQISLVGTPAPTLASNCEVDVLQDTVSWLIRARRQRASFLPDDVFAEPAWDILLDLFRAELGFERVSVSSACIAANVPSTTALRYIKSMTDQCLIVRRPDPLDGRRYFLELSPETNQSLRSYFENVIEAKIRDSNSLKN